MPPKISPGANIAPLWKCKFLKWFVLQRVKAVLSGQFLFQCFKVVYKYSYIMWHVFIMLPIW